MIDYIDWSPFFSTWELAGKFPAILDDKMVGEAARALYADAQKMLQRDRRASSWFSAAAAVGFWPAERRGRRHRGVRRCGARASRSRRCTRCASSSPAARAAPTWRSPISSRRAGHADHIGAFVVTAGIGEDEVADRFKNANDDYSSIMVKALADRLAEAFAERLHQRVRKEFWGYAADEALSNAELIAEKYRGIRPAPGYPAQPDHTEKAHAVPAARRRADRRAS